MLRGLIFGAAVALAGAGVALAQQGGAEAPAAAAVGGEVVAVDLLERADGPLVINEVNHTPEFHGAMEATDVDIAGRIVDYLIAVARECAETVH